MDTRRQRPMNTYPTINLALQALPRNSKKRVFSSDKYKNHQEKWSKEFYATSYDRIYNELRKNNECKLYEYIMSNDKCKLFIDIDENDVNTPIAVVKETIEIILFKIKKELNLKIDPEYSNILILKSDTFDKISFHIVIPDIIFNSPYDQKRFFTKIKSKLPPNISKYIDPSVYRKGEFRMIWSLKQNKGRRLMPFKIKNSIMPLEQYDRDIYDISCIANVNQENKGIEIEEEIKDEKQENYNKLSTEKLENLLSEIPQECWDYYPKWFQIMAALYNDNKGNLGLLIKHSKKSKHWKDETSEEWIRKKWKTLRDNYERKKIDIGTIIQMIGKTKNELKLLSTNKFMDMTEYDHTLLCIEEFKNDIKVYNTTKNLMFIWDENHKIFSEITDPARAIRLFQKFLNKLALLEIERIKNKNENKDLEDNKELNILNKRRDKITGFIYCEKIYKSAKDELLDLNFYLKINIVDYLLPIKNKKIVNLKTLEVRERNKEDYFSFYCPVNFEDLNKLGEVEKYLMPIMDNNPEKLLFLRKVFGYCLTGDNRARCFFILHGNGLNGKGMLVAALSGILNKFSATVDKSIVIKSKSKFTNDGGPNSALANIFGRRFGPYNETEKGDTLYEEQIKRLTGGDEITVNDKYKPQVTFTPQIKIMIASNVRVEADYKAKYIDDRLEVICFNHDFSKNGNNEQKADLNIKEKFTKEGEIRDLFFTWCCLGTKDWYEKPSFERPEIIEKERTDYINKSDSLEWFLTEACELKENDTKQTGSYLYKKYQEYCLEDGKKYLNLMQFHDKMKKKFGEQKKTKTGKHYSGIKYKMDEYEEEKENNNGLDDNIKDI